MSINIPSVPVVLPPNLMEAPNVDHHHLNTFLSPDKNKDYFYMANPVLGKSLCSDWLFLGQDFKYGPFPWKRSNSVYFCFGAKPANSTIATKTVKKKRVKIVILHIETTSRS